MDPVYDSSYRVDGWWDSTAVVEGWFDAEFAETSGSPTTYTDDYAVYFTPDAANILLLADPAPSLAATAVLFDDLLYLAPAAAPPQIADASDVTVTPASAAAATVTDAASAAVT